MMLRRWTDELPNDLEHLGFVLHENSARHIGILYHLDDGIVRFCHLGWNWDLCVENPSPRYFWGKSGLDKYNKRFLATNFDVIGRANPNTIPYGLDSSGGCFDEEGNYLPLPLGKGMTCASFIVSVFRSLGLPLVDEASWPRGRIEDQQWGQWVVEELTKDKRVPRDHVEAVKKDIENIRRFRPCEVGAALTSDSPPVLFADAERLATEILAEIAAARNTELETNACMHT